MKTLLLAGAMVLALVIGAVRHSAAMACPDPQWARIIHTAR